MKIKFVKISSAMYLIAMVLLSIDFFVTQEYSTEAKFYFPVLVLCIVKYLSLNNIISVPFWLLKFILESILLILSGICLYVIFLDAWGTAFFGGKTSWLEDFSLFVSCAIVLLSLLSIFGLIRKLFHQHFMKSKTDMKIRLKTMQVIIGLFSLGIVYYLSIKDYSPFTVLVISIVLIVVQYFYLPIRFKSNLDDSIEPSGKE